MLSRMAAAPPLPVAHLLLLQQQLPPVVVQLCRACRDTALVVHLSTMPLLAIATSAGAVLDATRLHLGGRHGACGRVEEVDVPTLELGVGCHDGFFLCRGFLEPAASCSVRPLRYTRIFPFPSSE
jgi:hypothetical protein